MTAAVSDFGRAYRKGAAASFSIFAIAYGLKTLGIPDFWNLISCLAYSTALIVGVCSGIKSKIVD